MLFFNFIAENRTRTGFSENDAADLLLDRFVIWTFFFLNIHNSFLPHAGTVGLMCRAFTLL